MVGHWLCQRSRILLRSATEIRERRGVAGFAQNSPTRRPGRRRLKCKDRPSSTHRPCRRRGGPRGGPREGKEGAAGPPNLRREVDRGARWAGEGRERRQKPAGRVMHHRRRRKSGRQSPTAVGRRRRPGAPQTSRMISCHHTGGMGVALRPTHGVGCRWPESVVCTSHLGVVGCKNCEGLASASEQIVFINLRILLLAIHLKVFT